MNRFKECFKWFVAVLAIAAIPTVSALAEPPTAEPKKSPPWPSNVPPVPRGIPDLVPYWAFDPPKSSLFDLKNLTVSGDLRVRPEFRTNGTFGITKRNDFLVQQWMRIGFNYSITPNVEVFLQPQYAKNWGSGGAVPGVAGAPCGANVCANDPFNVGQGDAFFIRQAYVLLRDVGVENLDFKLGRQLIVFGNHRLFGHFDWANTGFSHDGIMFRYAPQKALAVQGGWFRPSEGDFNSGPAAGNPDMFPLAVPGADGPSAGAAVDAEDDTDFFLLRADWKPMKGLSIEPMWVYFISGAASFPGSQVTQAHAPNQNRHTLGARAAWKGGAGGLKLDLTGEYYYQFGSIAGGPGTGNTSRDIHINAWAAAIMGGVTLANVPMSPRIGLEFNGASGDGDANCTSSVTCNGNANTFENLYPTNHILMGYMDLMAWRNMIAYSANLKLKPTAASHLEIAGWIMRRQVSGDNWYRAAQNIYFADIPGVTTSNSLGQEIDVIYTHFIMQGKVALQLGYGHFFPGLFVEQASSGNVNGSGPGGNPPGQDWGYAQVHVNF